MPKIAIFTKSILRKTIQEHCGVTSRNGKRIYLNNHHWLYCILQYNQEHKVTMSTPLDKSFAKRFGVTDSHHFVNMLAQAFERSTGGGFSGYLNYQGRMKFFDKIAKN